MANLVNLSNLLNYQNAGALFGRSSGNLNKVSAQDALSQIQALADKNSGNFNVNLSTEGLAAFQNQDASANVDTGIFNNADLSPKAQAFLGKIQEKYGDYDFIVADNVDDPQALAAGSSKNYSVIFSTEEIEKMANDEEYANSMLGNLEDAVKTAESVMENAQLDGNTQINQVAVSFDSDGNSKIFATLEKLSESQQERLDAAKEKRAEENAPQTFTVGAEDKESVLEQLRNFNWERFLAE